MQIASFLRQYCHLLPVWPGYISPHYIINCKIFEKKILYWQWNVSLDFYTTFVWNISHSERKSARYYYECTYCLGLHVKYPLVLSDFNHTWNFSTYFRKIFKYQTLWKSVQWEPSCSMRTDWHDDANVLAFRNFTNTPKIHINATLHFILNASCHIVFTARVSLPTNFAPFLHFVFSVSFEFV